MYNYISLKNSSVSSIYGGTKHTGKDKSYSKQMLDSYYANEIHKPFDQYEDDWKTEGIMQIINMSFQIGYRVALLDNWPVWYDGQPFKEIREKSLKAGKK